MCISIGDAFAWPRSVPIRAYFAAHFANCPLSFRCRVPVGPGLPLSPAFCAHEKNLHFRFPRSEERTDFLAGPETARERGAGFDGYPGEEKGRTFRSARLAI